MSINEKKRIVVYIHGVQYVIVGTESASHIKQVAQIVDEKMNEISLMNPSLDTNKLAVLTAINVVNDYIKAEERIKLLENELKNVKDWN